MMMSLTQPKYFLPLHGEYKHLKKHAALAESMGIPEENILCEPVGRNSAPCSGLGAAHIAK